MSGYETTWPVFLGIVALYIVVSLIIGARKAYFEPWQENSETQKDK